ncbi:fatty acid desaturase [Streptomyces sp. RPA4-5]|uniref:fatty acid desaturase family protein n=1 Tax=Streptomyces sp. RPA4-5 TaxID=2721245 RepID=UPI002001E2A1|nr:fatty acid desaturase [Streptomyces sp. RPA4-5]
MGVAGVSLVMTGNTIAVIAGILVLGFLYTHMVELQHQCLHHSAFLKVGLHRTVGVALGLPMMVSYSHYRIRHLQHHRHLGTDEDSEFFGFDKRQPLTARALLSSLFDYKRLGPLAVAAYRSWRGTWRYENGQVSERIRRDSIAEYRLMSLVLVAATVLSAAGFGTLVLQMWLLPWLLVATPLHFLVELPEHLYCEDDTTDVLRNTRSISGGRFSTWFTNGNNLHVEHHAAMTVAINRLPERHGLVKRFAVYTEDSYWTFYRTVLREVVANRSKGRRAAPTGTVEP